MTYLADINQLDLAFVVDTTGSMSSLIAAAQAEMVEMIEQLASAAAIDMRLGLVEYRDHPPPFDGVRFSRATRGKIAHKRSASTMLPQASRPQTRSPA